MGVGNVLISFRRLTGGDLQHPRAEVPIYILVGDDGYFPVRQGDINLAPHEVFVAFILAGTTVTRRLSINTTRSYVRAKRQ